MTDEPDELKKARFYLQEAHIFFDSTLDARRKLDNKTYNMIVFSSILLNLIFGLTYFLIEKQIILTQCTKIALLGSADSYLVAIVFGLLAYRPTSIVTRDIQGLIKIYEKDETKTESELVFPIQDLAWNLSRDAIENKERFTKKAFLLQLMLICFFIGLAFLTFALGSLLF